MILSVEIKETDLWWLQVEQCLCVRVDGIADAVVEGEVEEKIKSKETKWGKRDCGMAAAETNIASDCVAFPR